MHGGADLDRVVRVLANLFAIEVITSPDNGFHDSVNTCVCDIGPVLAAFTATVDSQGFIGRDTVAASAINDALHGGDAIELVIVKFFCEGLLLVVLAVLLDAPCDVHETAEESVFSCKNIFSRF